MKDANMKYKIGESVRVKSYEKIQETLDESNRLKGDIIYFNAEMKKYCDGVYKVISHTSSGHYYHLKNCEMEPGNCWEWPKDWLEPVNRFKKGSLAVVRPDLIPGKMYGRDAFIDDMIPTRGTVVEIANIDSTMDLYHIKENHWSYTDEMLLTLDEAFVPGRKVCKKDGTTFSNGSKIVTVRELTNSRAWFQETDSYLSVLNLIILPEAFPFTEKIATTTLDCSDLDFKIKIDPIKSNVIYSNWFNPIKTQNNEDQLQREKTRIRGAEIPEGHRVRSRKCKASVVIGHLSNQARVGY